jgi:hypothetical protein
MPKSRSSRRRRTEAQWSEILGRFESSGLDAIEFCRREGLALSSLQRWRRRQDSATAAEFVELVPTTTPATPSPSAWSFDVGLPNGVCLRFRG